MYFIERKNYGRVGEGDLRLPLPEKSNTMLCKSCTLESADCKDLRELWDDDVQLRLNEEETERTTQVAGNTKLRTAALHAEISRVKSARTKNAGARRKA